MWAKVENGQIVGIVRGNQGVTVNGTQYPSSIFKLWSKEELRGIGFVPYSIQKGGDTRFQTEGGVVNNLSDDGTEAIGVTQYTDKNLEDILFVKENGDGVFPVIDPRTGEQMVQTGLKTQYKNQNNQTCYSKLSVSDWYVIRATETGGTVPDAITVYRSAVRTKANEIEAAINACSTMDQFKALFVTPVDGDGKPTGNAPINDWPKE
jgi:hypothetical protein